MPFEINYNYFVGLAVLLGIWIAAVLAGRLLCSWSAGRAAHRKNSEALLAIAEARDWFMSIAALTLALIIGGWLAAFLFMGGVSKPTTDKNPEGQIESSSTPGELYSSDNAPRRRTPELREEGDELQAERMQELDDFRREFFERKEAENDATNN